MVLRTHAGDRPGYRTPSNVTAQPWLSNECLLHNTLHEEYIHLLVNRIAMLALAIRQSKVQVPKGKALGLSPAQQSRKSGPLNIPFGTHTRRLPQQD